MGLTDLGAGWASGCELQAASCELRVGLEQNAMDKTQNRQLVL
jgi:hypothetical protein